VKIESALVRTATCDTYAPVDPEQLLIFASNTRRQFTPPTDYRRELVVYPVDGAGRRCAPLVADGLRFCGRAGTRVLSMGANVAHMLEAIEAVVPDAQRRRQDMKRWSVDVLGYAQSLTQARFTARFGTPIFS